jgi:2,3-bisphosphoglycerate-independent phosphoglycerate mutase
MGKVLLVVLDGLGDRPINGRTPLSTAKTPNMNRLSEIGINGIMDTISPGIRPGSDTGHLSLLGYDPYKYYTGRGPIEAAGAGIDVKPGDVAFRINFGTVEGRGSVFDKVVVDRRAGRISDTDELEKAIINGVDLKKFNVEFIFRRGSGHRGALVLRGEKLSDRITDTDPHKIGEKVRKCIPLDDSEEAKRTAEIVNEFMEQSHAILENHPVNEDRAKKGLPKANVILIRGVGKCPHIPSFESMHGMKLAVIAGTTLIKGIGRLLKGYVPDVAGATGSKNTNLKNKVKAALEALRDYDFVLLHIKATDEFGHDGDFDGKKEFIEKVDEAIEPLLNVDLRDVCLIVTADHSTPVSVKEHTGDPVPVIIAHEGVRVDDVREFSEFEAYKGGLCRINGMGLFRTALDLVDRIEKFGA